MAAPAALAFHANIPCLASATSATLRASLTRCSAASMVAPNSRSFETEPMGHDRVSGDEHEVQADPGAAPRLWLPDDSPERGRRADPFQGDAGDPDDG
jgi:hypothetical protein